MSVTPISKKVRDDVYSRLAHPTVGFNPLLLQYANSPEYAIVPFSIDFSPSGYSFVFGFVDPMQKELSGIFKYPFMCLYTTEAKNQNIQKFNKFSGSVTLKIDTWYSWPQVRGVQNYEKYADCIEAVMIDIFNREDNQRYTFPLVYNGGISFKRYKVELEGENWRQRFETEMHFEIHTM